MYQKLVIIGYLGRDPEMRYLPDGTAVTKFSIATSEKWTDKAGAKQEETTWFTCDVWGKKAETAHQYLSKGSKVLVEGRLKPDANTGGPRLWTAQDGTVRANFEVKVDNFKFLDSKGDNNDNQNHNEPNAKNPKPSTSVAVGEDDLPFQEVYGTKVQTIEQDMLTCTERWHDCFIILGQILNMGYIVQPMFINKET